MTVSCRCSSGRPINRDVARFGSVEHLMHVIGEALPELGVVGPISISPPASTQSRAGVGFIAGNRLFSRGRAARRWWLSPEKCPKCSYRRPIAGTVVGAPLGPARVQPASWLLAADCPGEIC